MEMQQIIEQAENNIWQAIKDYAAHTYQTGVMDDVNPRFVKRLAKDSAYAKQELRELFRKSPVWDDSIDALAINGTRTHNPDGNVIFNLGCDILDHVMYAGNEALYQQCVAVLRFFAYPNNAECQEKGLEALNTLAPKAYAPGKKLSRVFKAFCDKLGVSDNTAGSRFQKLYAQFADELSAKKISFKLFVSINPAHFITMSNPKGDERGSTLTSCHSFNSTEYDYNNGCTGYARDKTSFIVFTVDNPANPESLNNRKTTRQIFAYKPGNGVLLQSRLYNTSGGTRGAQEESKVYRDLIQRELSMLEGEVNLWKTYPVQPDHYQCIEIGTGFGGYPDWHYEDFNAMVSIRVNCEHTWEPIKVGTYGLCICCGDEISAGLYCDECDDNGCRSRDDDGWYCDRCDQWADPDERYTVYDVNGHEISVCEDCYNRYYTRCEECEEDFDNDVICRVTDRDGCTAYVCEDCRDEHYSRCDECDEYFHDDIVHSVVNEHGTHTVVCDDCFNEHYLECDDCHGFYHESRVKTVHTAEGDKLVCCDCVDHEYHYCEKCGEWFSDELTTTIYRKDGTEIRVCQECAEDYEICPNCGESIEKREDGICPACGAVVEEEKEAEAV